MQSLSAQSMERRARIERRVKIVLLVLCVIGAIAVLRRLSVFAVPPTPGAGRFPGLDEHFTAKEGAILLHIVPALLFVLLVPLQFTPSLRRRYPRLHRWTGRLLMLTGIVIGTSALWLSTRPVGGLAEASATMFFACCFLFSLGKAWWHIRHKRIELHREWVTRMTAIALGVATTRPIMGVFFATSTLTGLTPQQFFGPAMWLGISITCIAGECVIHALRKPDTEVVIVPVERVEEQMRT
jgi:hypothetical protein